MQSAQRSHVHSSQTSCLSTGVEAGSRVNGKTCGRGAFYDFNVWTERKRIERLRYMHRNPVKRGLVSQPEQWLWSSFRSYAHGEIGSVRVNFQGWPLEIKGCPWETFGERRLQRAPLIRKERE
jgi:hypothetical protein